MTAKLLAALAESQVKFVEALTKVAAALDNVDDHMRHTPPLGVPAVVVGGAKP
jgi:hypothetical protein